jgi:hypothetical protein
LGYGACSSHKKFNVVAFPLRLTKLTVTGGAQRNEAIVCDNPVQGTTTAAPRAGQTLQLKKKFWSRRLWGTPKKGANSEMTSTAQLLLEVRLYSFQNPLHFVPF